MNWAYASIIQAFVIALVMALICIGVYKLTNRNSK